MTGVRRALALLGALTALAAPLALTAPAQAATVAPADCGHVYAGPYLPAGAENVGYFDLAATAGETRVVRLVVANPSGSTCRVRLQAAVGRTATNSGDTYAPTTSDACTGAGCWVAGLPATVTVRPRARRTVPFRVTVPAGTGGGQYLAGVIASPADELGGGGAGQVRVRVATRVAVGVAVRVAGALSPEVSISGVRVDTSAPPARTVLITERDTGNTWEHPKGTMSVQVGGRTVSVPVVSNTVLAGEQADLRLGAERVPAGTYPARVVLRYADGARSATWRGTLVFGAPAAVHRSGSTVVVATDTTPAWMPMLLAASVGTSVLLLVALLLVLLKRRRRPDPVVASVR